MAKATQLIKNIFIYGTSSILSKIIGVILLPFYTRVFSLGDYGVMDILSVLVAFFVLLFSIQMDQGHSYYFSTRRSNKEKVSYATTVISFYIIMFSLVAAFIIGFSETLSNILFNTNAYTYAVKAMGIYLCVYSIKYIFFDILKWKNDAKKYAGFSLIETILSFVTVLLFVGVFKLGLPGLYFASALNATILLVACFYYIKDLFELKYLSYKRFCLMYRYSWPLVFSCVSVYFLQMTDRFMITKFIDIEAAGLYGMGFRLSSIIMIVLSGFQVAWGPFVMTHHRDDNTPFIIRASFERLFAFFVLALAFLSLFSPEVLMVIATPAFFPSYKLVPFLMLSILLFTISGYFSFGLILAKKTKLIAVSNVVLSVLNVVLNYIGIYFFGLLGAVIATVLSFTLLFCFVMNKSQKYYYVEYRWKTYASLFILIFGFLLLCVFTMPVELNVSWLFLKLFFVSICLFLVFKFKLVTVKEFTDLYNKFKLKVT